MGAAPPTLLFLEVVIASAITAIIGLAGLTLFVLLLVGGMKYLTSGGDPKAVEGAKLTITHAIGGLVLILCSYLIILLIQSLFNVNITNFSIVLP